MSGISKDIPMSTAKMLLPLLALCLMLGACQQDQKSARNDLVVVDLGRVIAESEPGKAAQAYIGDLQKGYNDQLVAAQEKLKKNSKDEKALQELQMLYGNMQQRFQQEEGAVTNALLERLLSTVQEVRQQKGYKLIVRSEAVVAQDKGLDVTSEVMDAFNKVTIDFKAAAKEAVKEAAQEPAAAGKDAGAEAKPEAKPESKDAKAPAKK